jgi:hypothetical protein
MGVGVAGPLRAAGARVFVGPRLTAADLADPALTDAIASAGVTVVVDAPTASAAAPQIARLASAGVEIANGGWGRSKGLRWERAHADVVKAGDVIHRHCGVRVVDFVPGRRFDAFDQMWSRRRGERLVQTDAVVRTGKVPEHVTAAKVYIIDGRRDDPSQVRRTLLDFQRRIQGQGLVAAPLAQLR